VFALNALAAALQGIGFGPLHTALQGLVAVTVVPEPLPIVRRKTARPITTTRRRGGRRRVISPMPVEQLEPADDEEVLVLAMLM